jgi:hypothetical protein
MLCIDVNHQILKMIKEIFRKLFYKFRLFFKHIINFNLNYYDNFDFHFSKTSLSLNP